MPTYEYQCQKCDKHFEVFQKITDAPLFNHAQITYKESGEPETNCTGKLKRIISGGAGIIFKGKGFYATDYKKTTQEEIDNKED